MSTNADLDAMKTSALDAVKKMREVTLYILINKTQKEIYLGVTTAGRVLQRFEEHCGGKTVALQHWDCSDDHIDPARIGSYSKREDASRLGHLFERAFNGSPEAMFMLYLNDTRVHGLVMEALRHFKGYKAIETKGI